MMQTHMLANMRDHLVAINEIIAYIAADDLDKAGEVAEERLGMSALDNHHASHMAKFMPKGMREHGTAMHKAASRFAVARLKAKCNLLSKLCLMSPPPALPAMPAIVFVNNKQWTST